VSHIDPVLKMEYRELAVLYDRLHSTMSKLEKRDILAEFYKKTPSEELGFVVLLSMGKVFPEWDARELGVGPKLLLEALSSVTGRSGASIEKMVAKTGDLGETTEQLLAGKAQTTLFQEVLTVKRVYNTLVEIGELEGSGSQEKMLKHLKGLLLAASPREGKYLVRTILGQMRVGVGEGLVRDAIAASFGVPVELVERGIMLTNDVGEVARVAREQGEKGLQLVGLRAGRPVKPMAAQSVRSVEEAIQEMGGGEVAFEIKFDGARVQIHKLGGELKVFSRRLEDVTHALEPDIVPSVLKALKVRKGIFEGEVVAIDTKTGRPRPFQDVLRRFRRKYRVEEIANEIPLEIHLFEALLYNSKELITLPFYERRKILESVVEPDDGVEVAEQLVTADPGEAEKLYKRALEMGHEGVMAKKLESDYFPGVRGKRWLKVKPLLDTLDLAVVGGFMGEGRRSELIGSYIVAAMDADTSELEPVGRVGTGMDDSTLMELTRLFDQLIVSRVGKEVVIQPKIVFEVGFEEVQRSTKYKCGYALRFPRFIRVREDKSVDQVDTLETIGRIYEMQRGRRRGG